MQLAVTLTLVLLAACYAAYELWRSVYPALGKGQACGHGCGGCPQKSLQNEKGEPVTLVPLEVIRKR